MAALHMADFSDGRTMSERLNNPLPAPLKISHKPMGPMGPMGPWALALAGGPLGVPESIPRGSLSLFLIVLNYSIFFNF